MDYNEALKMALRKNVSKKTLLNIARELYQFSGEEKARIAIVLLNQSNEADKAILDLVFEELFDNEGITEFNYSEIIELLPKVIMFGRQQEFIQCISQSSFLDPEEKGDILVQYNEQEEDQAEYDGREPVLADDTWF